MRAGLLEERTGNAAVTDAIVADETLTERQRQTLLDIYGAFQSENAAAEPGTTDSPRTGSPSGAEIAAPVRPPSARRSISRR